MPWQKPSAHAAATAVNRRRERSSRFPLNAKTFRQVVIVSKSAYCPLGVISGAPYIPRHGQSGQMPFEMTG